VGVLDIGVAVVVGAAAGLLTIAVVALLVPAGATFGPAALTFLPLSAALSGYSAWRWVRWVRSRAERLHWSVFAAVGLAMTFGELYGAAGWVTSSTEFFQRLTGLAAISLFVAVTEAVSGVAALVVYQRSVNDRMLMVAGARRRRWLTAGGLRTA
jgi:hypothetical protein